MIVAKAMFSALETLGKQGYIAYHKELTEFYSNNPQDNLTYAQFKDRTSRAKRPLQDHCEAIFYTVAYALPHYLNLRHQLNSITISGEGKLGLQVIDYGCGQGVATVALMEYLAELGHANECELDIWLIEPSNISLQIAEELIKQLAKAHGMLVNINKQACQLAEAKLPTKSACGNTLHLMSNVLDVHSVQLGLQSLIEKISAISGEHILLATSPSYNDTKLGFGLLKQLLKEAKVEVECKNHFWHSQYKITQNKWHQVQAKRRLLNMTWSANTEDFKVAC